MSNKQQLKPESRETLCRLAFIGILLSLFYGWYSGVLFHQMEAPVLRFPFLDPIFWVAHLLSIPEIITSNTGIAIAADCLLIASAVLAAVFPAKRIFPSIFFSIYLLYFISFNSFGAHHTLNKVAVLLMPVAFMFKQKRFELLWEGLRYYLLLVFTSAFCWKLFRLSWLHPQQGEIILKRNLAPYLYFNAHTKLAALYRYLLASPALMQFSFLAGFIMEGSFIIGFFTKQFDRILLLICVLLVFGFWFFADAFFGEFLLFLLTFFPVKTKKSRDGQQAESADDGAIIT